MAENSHLQVALRARPIDAKDIDEEIILELKPELRQVDVVKFPQKTFTFDYVFDCRVSQEEIFNQAVKPAINKAYNGSNVCIMAYGQTGSGKTYTMGSGRIGSHEETQGIVPRVFHDIFSHINMENGEHKIIISFLEVYNDEVYDLFGDKNDRVPLTVREDKTGIKLPELNKYEVNSVEEALKYFSIAVESRTTAATASNVLSSRSHAIINISLKVDGENSRYSKIRLVDLAGSEAVNKTRTASMTFREGININSSLLELGNVIEALNQEKTHIPYRNSVLTRLLQDSLGGYCQTLMIACIYPILCNYAETSNTLRYAERARGIKSTSYSAVKRNIHRFRTPAKRAAPLPINSALKQSKRQTDLNHSNLKMPFTRLQKRLSDDDSIHLAEISEFDQALNSTMKENSLTPLAKKLEERIASKFFSSPMMERMASKIHQKFNDTFESFCKSPGETSLLGRLPLAEKSVLDHQNNGFEFRVPALPTAKLMASRRESVTQFNCSRRNDVSYNESKFYAQSNGNLCQQTPSFHRSSGLSPRRYSICQFGNTQILPSPMRGWKIRLDPNMIEKNNQHVLDILNTADTKKLATLPCIGTKMAQIIASWIEVHGAMEKIEDMMHINGLPKSFYSRFIKANIMNRLDV